ncbi:sulfurtransferase [Cytobacillus purgationiresistens]|uniref:Thiosulfate/3-mercaptopyruvate sulfurtransferase n=1 Tax=Cytobacillus purgationiresistens TaxID=863449 RepID=A0ABU0AMT7_9BACI|nr:sulfurtransferase [Cytobacillus purgationiresistens]MDQ0272061.1 thiosulfate/3-mercaptopyruvate sulfurtransferase [Cytobacillus purgationiresistens]
MKNLVDADWLFEHLTDENVRIADCRFNLAASEEGKTLYLKGHIPGSIYFHLEKNLSGPVSEHGGRHPLPDADRLAEALENAGINNDTTIIAYDGGENSFASRFWWLLKFLGHDKVYVLDGGYQDWTAKGYPIDSALPSYSAATYKVRINEGIMASHDEVKKISLNEDSRAVLIDSREEKRYLGIIEPIDKKAGHIPGAVNKVWTESLSEGKFKTAEALANRFSEFDKDRPLIVYCGSGVTASPNFLALKEAGYKNVKLYPGSFSDWISYDENPIGTGK